jgi:hypothetical protein
MEAIVKQYKLYEQQLRYQNELHRKRQILKHLRIFIRMIEDFNRIDNLIKKIDVLK